MEVRTGHKGHCKHLKCSVVSYISSGKTETNEFCETSTDKKKELVHTVTEGIELINDYLVLLCYVVFFYSTE